MKRAPMRSRYRDTGPGAETVAVVVERDRGLCAVCGHEVSGTRGLDWSVQHRLARKGGGTQRRWVNFPSNLVLLCGHGTTGCHFRVESQGAWARDQGYKIREGRWRPPEVGIEHAAHGRRVYLTDDGGISDTPPEVAA